MIEVSNLTKQYGEVTAVDEISFSIGKGEIVGLLGPNGAGKTTVMKVLTCYHFPTKGEVSVNSFNVYNEPLEIKKSIGYLPENAPLYEDLTVAEYLDFISRARGIEGEDKKAKLDKVLHECGLPPVLHKPIQQLSKGYRQRVGLAQAIIHDPQILILDEPTSGLDPKQIMEIRELIQKLGNEKTVILSTHILQEVEAVCSRVLILNEGTIRASGTTEEIGRELKGETTLLLTVKGGTPEILKNSVAAVSTVIGVQEARQLENGKNFMKMTLQSGDDPGEPVFDWALKQDVKILEMKYQRLSLEDIFLKITTEGGEQQ
jgi:ABC-2 type transport system ATP-binding protein